jgi:hypothetical protein
MIDNLDLSDDNYWNLTPDTMIVSNQDYYRILELIREQSLRDMAYNSTINDSNTRNHMFNYDGATSMYCSSRNGVTNETGYFQSVVCWM